VSCQLGINAPAERFGRGRRRRSRIKGNGEERLSYAGCAALAIGSASADMVTDGAGPSPLKGCFTGAGNPAAVVVGGRADRLTSCGTKPKHRWQRSVAEAFVVHPMSCRRGQIVCDTLGASSAVWWVCSSSGRSNQAGLRHCLR